MPWLGITIAQLPSLYFLLSYSIAILAVFQLWISIKIKLSVSSIWSTGSPLSQEWPMLLPYKQFKHHWYHSIVVIFSILTFTHPKSGFYGFLVWGCLDSVYSFQLQKLDASTWPCRETILSHLMLWDFFSNALQCYRFLEFRGTYQWKNEDEKKPKCEGSKRLSHLMLTRKESSEGQLEMPKLKESFQIGLSLFALCWGQQDQWIRQL